MAGTTGVGKRPLPLEPTCVERVCFVVVIVPGNFVPVLNSI